MTIKTEQIQFKVERKQVQALSVTLKKEYEVAIEKDL